MGIETNSAHQQLAENSLRQLATLTDSELDRPLGKRASRNRHKCNYNLAAPFTDPSARYH